MRQKQWGQTLHIDKICHLIDHFLDYKNAKIYALVRDLNNLKWLKGLNINLLVNEPIPVAAAVPSHQATYVIRIPAAMLDFVAHEEVATEDPVAVDVIRGIL